MVNVRVRVQEQWWRQWWVVTEKMMVVVVVVVRVIRRREKTVSRFENKHARMMNGGAKMSYSMR